LALDLLDLLVIQKHALDINMTMDIVVVPFSRFEALREKLGLIYREADRHGKVVYES